MPEVCVDCDNAKAEAEAKAAKSTGKDGLNLGGCQEIYKRWASCIEANSGQAKACKAVMDEFKACHTMSATAIELPQARRRH